MIFLIVGIIAIIAFWLLELHFRKTKNTNEYGLGYFLAGFFGFCFIFFGSIIPSIVGYVNEIDNETAITQYKSNEVIYQKKADTITAQLSTYLSVQYPNLEKDILGSLAKNPNLLFLKFPQLRSSETIISLANQYSNLESQVFTQETNVTAKEQKIQARQRDIFLLQFVIPNHK